jgi:hypothetical protein
MQIISDLFLSQIMTSIQANQFTANQLRLHLFKNNWPEDCGPLLADLEEADFDGYASVLLNLNWGSPSVAGHVAQILYPAIITFTCTGATTPNDIYGYYLTSSDSADLKIVEKNPAGPVTLSAAGQPYVVVPVFQFASWDLVPCPV